MGTFLKVLSSGLLALWGALQGWAGRAAPESQGSQILFLLPRHFTPRLIRHDQTERSSQRLPQRHHAWGADMEARGEDTAWSQGGLCGWGWTVLHPALLGCESLVPTPPPPQASTPPHPPSPPCPPHTHSPGRFALPLPALRLVKGRQGSWGSWVVNPFSP